jgi:hypothetical protein
MAVSVRNAALHGTGRRRHQRHGRDRGSEHGENTSHLTEIGSAAIALEIAGTPMRDARAKKEADPEGPASRLQVLLALATE